MNPLIGWEILITLLSTVMYLGGIMGGFSKDTATIAITVMSIVVILTMFFTSRIGEKDSEQCFCSFLTSTIAIVACANPPIVAITGIICITILVFLITDEYSVLANFFLLVEGAAIFSLVRYGHLFLEKYMT